MDRFGYQSAAETRTRATNGHGPTLTHLVSGIVSDVGELFEQQVQLLREEIKDNLRAATSAAIWAATACFTLSLSAIGLVFTAAYVLSAIFPNFPLWACFACVTGFLAIVGVITLLAANAKAKAVHAFPIKSAAEFKENLQCMNPIPKR